ncbi:MAG: chemotaxis protein CheX [Clostridiales bacterium]
MDMRLIDPFVNSTKNIIEEMTQINIDILEKPYFEDGDMESFGVASVINFSGKMRGRFLIDISKSLSNEIVYCMLEEKLNLKDRMYVAAISEMNNTITGDANTFLNNEYHLGLRLAPPIVFTGRKVVISASKIDSFSVKGKTKYGEFKLNIGFQEELK